MWIFISGCCKFTAQVTLRYVDRLSPQLLTLSNVATPLCQDRKKSVLWILSFFHLATTIYQSSKTRGELDVFPLLLLLQGKRCGSWGCFSPFMSLRLYIHNSPFLCSIHQSTFIFPPSSFWTRSYLLSSLILVPPSLHPHTHGVITICLMSSTVKQKEIAMTQEGKNSCFLHDYTLAPLVTSAAFRIIAQVANFLTEGSPRTKWSWTTS